MRAKLGKKVDRKERIKAVPSVYPNEGPCGLVEAYEQLSRPAFSVWIRLSVADPHELRQGRARLSRFLGYSRRQGDELLRELERTGFITFLPHGPWRRTVIVIVRKPLLERGHGFARFSAFLFSPISEMHFREQSAGKTATADSRNPYQPIDDSGTSTRIVKHFPQFVKHLHGSSGTYTTRAGALCKSIAIGCVAENRNRGKMAVSTSRVKRHKFISETSYFDETCGYKDLITLSKLEERDRRRLLRSSNRARRDHRNAANRARGVDVLDWRDLDIVTFDPRAPKHRVMRVILARKPKDADRVALVKRLETEFCRLYSRYRRAAERAKGRPVSSYEVSKKERKYAAAAGVLCVQRGVTPRQLMEFWHANIKHFRHASAMNVPTLSFLSGAANIDTVACGLVLDETAPGGARIGATAPTADGADLRPRAGNSFCDTTRLDARLRVGLEAAGFSTREFNDRYLLTVQKNAQAIAAGRDIFIGRGALRDMSRWAASNLYAK